MIAPKSPSAESAPALPWVTLLVTLAAVAVYFWPASANALVFDRELLNRGEWWRVFSGHFVHFSGSHLLWNLAVLAPSGAWAERLDPRRARALYVFAPVAIGSTLFWLEPELWRYGGLSGTAAAMLAFLALVQLRLGTKDRWFWRGVLALLAVKIVVEGALASPTFARFADPGIRSVPLSHLVGVACAAMLLNLRRRPPSR